MISVVVAFTLRPLFGRAHSLSFRWKYTCKLQLRDATRGGGCNCYLGLSSGLLGLLALIYKDDLETAMTPTVIMNSSIDGWAKRRRSFIVSPFPVSFIVGHALVPRYIAID
jgi:hypothetical protein